MDHNGVYDKLAEKYKQVGSQVFMNKIKVMVTPEEGEILLALNDPLTPHELAQKMNVDEKSLTVKLENLVCRGLLFRGKEQYVAWKDSHQLNARVMFSKDEYIPQELWRLRKEDQRYTSSPHAEINGWLKRYETTGVPLVRILPARLALLASPKIKPEDVLWYEDVAQLFKKADMIGVIDCNCRKTYHRCDKPTLSCFHFSKNIVEYEVGRGGRMKALTPEEALAISDDTERAGLVHETPVNNASLPGVLCSCCNDCCSVFEPALHDDKLKQVCSPSRFRAVVNQETCTGCQKCIERCPFDAIEVNKVPNSKKMKAKVIDDKCMGCGVCVLGCKSKSMTMDMVRPPEHIPAKPAVAVAGATYNLK